MAFADLYLEDIRAYREERLIGAGKEAFFPLWRRGTAALARTFVDAGFETTLVCDRPEPLDPSFAGRRSTARSSPTCATASTPAARTASSTPAGPIFARPIEFEVGETVECGGLVFTDLLASERPAGPH